MTATDLELLLLKCRNPGTRALASEALVCYQAGAYRASILCTWTALVHDFVDKLRQLDVLGDKAARHKLEELDGAVRSNNTRSLLEFERTLLANARDEFELLTAIEHDELTRLLEDRHKCAHPSMLSADQEYQPSAEAARYHLRNAIEYCLQHPPVQGKVALERLLGELDRPTFPNSVNDLVTYLSVGPLAKPRSALLRNYLVVLLKEVLGFLPSPELPEGLLRPLSRRKERALLAISAMDRMHHAGLQQTMAEKLDELVAATNDEKLHRAVELIGALPELLDHLSRAQRERLARFVSEMPRAALKDALDAAWSTPLLRNAAETRIVSFETGDWNALGAGPFPRRWLDLALEALAEAPNFNAANAILRKALIPSAGQLAFQDLDRIAQIATTNTQVLGANALETFLGVFSGISPEHAAEVIRSRQSHCLGG
jgi:hypothetical protein